MGNSREGSKFLRVLEVFSGLHEHSNLLSLVHVGAFQDY
jgi:hypothetical protein